MPDQDSSPILQLTPQDIQRFWAKVKKGELNECWIWMAATSKKGYGIFTVRRNHIGAHRISWAICFGIMPDLCVCHDCPKEDNKRCVNPMHLWLGTDSENREDARNKGRFSLPITEEKREKCKITIKIAHKASMAKFAAMTSCKRGHLYSAVNTYVRNGRRQCRICSLQSTWRYRAKKRLLKAIRT